MVLLSAAWLATMLSERAWSRPLISPWERASASVAWASCVVCAVAAASARRPRRAISAMTTNNTAPRAAMAMVMARARLSTDAQGADFTASAPRRSP